MNLTAEQIQSNWIEFRNKISDYFPTRKTQLNQMYDDLEERIVMMPASTINYYHNAIPGGYVDHVLRVMRCADLQYNMWRDAGADVSGYTYEELMFAAMHHDLGKVGFPGEGNEVYQPETSDWHRKNMGRMYKQNENIPFAVVPDLSVWLLQNYDIKVSWNEYQAIKIHDGVYDDANKPYFMSRSEKAKLKTNLPIILHHADHMAAQIEFETWRNHKNNTPVVSAPKSKSTQKNGIKNLAANNPNVESEIADIFKTFGN